MLYGLFLVFMKPVTPIFVLVETTNILLSSGGAMSTGWAWFYWRTRERKGCLGETCLLVEARCTREGYAQRGLCEPFAGRMRKPLRESKLLIPAGAFMSAPCVTPPHCFLLC